jgi:hypothetical protein
LKVSFPTFAGILAIWANGRNQPDPARPPHRPAIFKNEIQEWKTGNLSSAAGAVIWK